MAARFISQRKSILQTTQLPQQQFYRFPPLLCSYEASQRSAVVAAVCCCDCKHRYRHDTVSAAPQSQVHTSTQNSSIAITTAQSPLPPHLSDALCRLPQPSFCFTPCMLSSARRRLLSMRQPPARTSSCACLPPPRWRNSSIRSESSLCAIIPISRRSLQQQCAGASAAASQRPARAQTTHQVHDGARRTRQPRQRSRGL